MSIFGMDLVKIEKMRERGNTEGLIKALLPNNGYEVRHAAIKALGIIGDDNAIEPLCKLLHDSTCLFDAVEALGNLRNVRAVEPLIIAMKNSSETDSYYIVRALGKIGGESAVGALCGALKSSSVAVRESAAKALGELGDASAIGSLCEALESSYQNVSVESARALSTMGILAIEPMCTTLRHSYGSVRQNTVEAIGRMGEVALPQLSVAMQNCDKSVRNLAVEALAQISGECVVEPLSQALLDSDAQVRNIAAQALGRKGYASAAESLLIALRDADITVRKSAAEALERIGIPMPEDTTSKVRDMIARGRWEECISFGQEAVEQLCSILKDINSGASAKAAETLGNMGATSAVVTLCEALESGKKEVRYAAAEALGRIGDSRAIEPLSKALQYNYYGDINIAAIKALGKIGDDRSFKPLEDALRDQDTQVRYAAAKAIENSSLPSDITTTIRYLIAQNKWEECVTLGNDAVKPLCEVLMTMSENGKGFTPAWVPQGAASPDSEKWYWEDIKHRQEIIKALVKIGDPKACTTLDWISNNDPYSINLLEYEEIPARDLIWPIREAAAEAIKQINHTNTEMK